mgnify:CR=1 FL=1
MKKLLSKLMRGASCALFASSLLLVASCSDGSEPSKKDDDSDTSSNALYWIKQSLATDSDAASVSGSTITVDSEYTSSGNAFKFANGTSYGGWVNFLATTSKVAAGHNWTIKATVTVTEEVKANNASGIGVGFTTGFTETEGYGYEFWRNNNHEIVQYYAKAGSSLTGVGTTGSTVSGSVGTAYDYVMRREGSNFYYGAAASGSEITETSAGVSNWYNYTADVYPCIAFAGVKATITSLVITDDTSNTTLFSTSAKNPTIGAYTPATISLDVSGVQYLNVGESIDVTVTATKPVAGATAEAAEWTAKADKTTVIGVTGSGTSGGVAKITARKAGTSVVTFTNASDETMTATLTISVAKFLSENNAEITLSDTYAYPANGATDAYRDSELRLTFDQKVAINENSYISIYEYDAATGTASEEAVDVIAFVDETQTVWSGVTLKVGAQLARLSSDEKSVYFRPHYNVLEAGKTYFVVIPEGSITQSDGSSVPTMNGKAFSGLAQGYDGTNGWSFTTRADATVSTANAITVNNAESDTTADFHSVYAALYALREATGTYTINLAAGNYYELVWYKGTADVRIVGQGSAEYGTDTVISYVNCNDMNSGTHYRATFYWGGGSDLRLENITIKNLTERNTQYITTVAPTNASQAEALTFANANDSSTYRAKAALAVYNCTFYSHQDTILTSGKNWFYKCHISGDVDFLWGTAEACLFENCTLVNLVYSNETSMIVSRCVENGKSTLTDYGKGYVIKDCTIEIPASAKVCLGRDTQSVGSALTWYDQAAVINTTINNVGTLNSALWYESCEVGYTSVADAYGTKMPIGWKIYNLTYANSLTPTLAKSCEMAAGTYTAEYSTRALILDRLVNAATSAYSDATDSKWDAISAWSLADLVSAFGAE